MKQFNLMEYLANPSRKIVTRDGRKVRIICTDVRSTFPVIALVERFNGDIEDVEEYTKDGKYYEDEENVNDLFFAQEKHEGWFNIYLSEEIGFFVRQNHPYKSKHEADEIAKANPKTFFATAKIEWEE